MNGEEANQRRAELWMRSFAPAARSEWDGQIDRLETLADRGVFDAFDVDVWGNEVERTEGLRRVPSGRRIADRLDSFYRWADRTDRSLEPFFRTRIVESEITDERHRTCRLPTVALAEYDGDRLVHVAPSRTEAQTIRVEDRLETLEERARTDDDSERRLESPPGW